jgi:flagellar biosynthesis/type III secretory pathway chaperone
METAWESELAEFLTDLSAVQTESLQVLTQKRQALAAWDSEALKEVAQREEGLVENLQRCLERRSQLLKKAAQEGLPSGSIRSLTAALSGESPRQLADQLVSTTRRARLLRHHSLTNWVLVQRTLIHLSQLLEIIATGGQNKPTYSREESATNSGALVDRVA